MNDDERDWGWGCAAAIVASLLFWLVVGLFLFWWGTR